MHTDFRVTPDPESRFTTEVLLAPVRSVGRSLAGVAFRSFYEVCRQGASLWPGFSLGRLQVPLPVVQSHNNLCRSRIGDPLPCDIVSLKDPKSKKPVWLVLYTDRTALIMREESDAPADLNAPLMRVLPIVLKLHPAATVKHRSTTYKLSVTSSEGKGAIMLKPLDGSLDTNLMLGPYSSRFQMEDAQILVAQLHHEMLAWMQLFETLPLIGDAGVHLNGRYGQELASPHPELEGCAFAWPAAMPGIGFSAERFEKAHRFLHLAFLHLVHLHGADMKTLGVRVRTSEFSQIAIEPKIEISLSAVGVGQGKSSQSKELLKEFRRLLQHEKAPPFLFQMQAQTVIENEKGLALSKVRPYDLYVGSMDDPASHHDRLASYALFTN